MIRKIYLLLLLSLPILSSAQTPVPFPTQDATWLYGQYDDFGNLYFYHNFWLDGDSSYLGETWSVLYQGGYEGLIREDSTQKVWFVPENMTAPELLYDFGTVVGDTIYGIRTQFVVPKDTVVVTQVYTYAGEKIWSLESISNGSHYTWTEGRGDESWLSASSPMNLVSGTTYFICFSHTAYTAPSNPCIVATEEAFFNRLSLGPNPSDGMIRLEFDQPTQISSMIVSDLQGRMVKSYPEFQELIDLQELEPGVYFLSVQNGEKLINKKLVIQ